MCQLHRQHTRFRSSQLSSTRAGRLYLYFLRECYVYLIFFLLIPLPVIAAPADYSDAPADGSAAPISGTTGYGLATHNYNAAVRLGATITDEVGAIEDADNGSDDGIDLSGLMRGFPKLLTATVPFTNGTGYFQGWIDWNGDGDFLDAGEQVATDLRDDGTGYDGTFNDGQIQFLVQVPATAANTAWARFRYSSDAGLGSTGSATDGEVEDYAITVSNYTPPPSVPAGACTAGSLIDNGDFNVSTGWTESHSTHHASGPVTFGLPGVNSPHTIEPFTGINRDGVQRSYVDTDGNLDAPTVNVRNNTVFSITHGRNYLFSFDAQEIPNIADKSALITWVLVDATTGAIAQTIPGSLVELNNGDDATGSFPAMTTDWQTFSSEFAPMVPTGNYQLAMTFDAYDEVTIQIIDFYIDRVYLAPVTVCDYSDAPADAGAAPDGTPGALAYGETHHAVSGLSLGAGITDETGAVEDADNTSDNGISVPTLTPGATADVTIEAGDITGVGIGTLHAWIDFDGDGIFAAAEYASVGFNHGATGPLVFSSYGTTMVAGTTYARFRLTSDTLTPVDVNTTASDGEVEDYAVTIEPAPAACLILEYNASLSNTNQVVLSDGSNTLTVTKITSCMTISGNEISGSGSCASPKLFQVTSSGFPIGAFSVAGARDIDANTSRDSFSFNIPGTITSPTLTVTPLSAPLPAHDQVSRHISAGAVGSYVTNEGPHDQHGEAGSDGHVVNFVPTNSVTTFNMILADVQGSDGILTSFRFDETRLNCPVGSTDLDYGDAPADGSVAPDGTGTTAYGEASHEIVSGIQLGVAIDADAATLASADAAGDGAEDDGVRLSGTTLQDQVLNNDNPVTLTLTTAGAGRLHGWIDWDGDGVFGNNANELVISESANASGTRKISLLPPNSLTPGTSYARFRYSTDAAAASPNGSASDGEVEDYRVLLTRGFSINGRVFVDANVDGFNAAGESGVSELPVVLYDTVNDSCISTRTNANGVYHFADVIPGDYQVYEASRESVPVPQNCGPANARDPIGYLSTTAGASAVFTVSNASISGIDFGDVKPPVFELDNTQAVLPNTTVLHPHVFTALTDGHASFSIAAETADPASLSWGRQLWVDSNCDGQLDSGDTPVPGSLPVIAGEQVCVLAKVVSPANFSAGAIYTLAVQSDFAFGDGSSLLTNDVQTRQDITRSIAGTTTAQPVDPVVDPVGTPDPVAGEGKLSLVKSVWNVSRHIEGEVALPGETLRYTIHYTNIGNGPLNELMIHDSVPEFTQLVPASMLCTDTPAELPVCAANNSLNGGLSWRWTSEDNVLPGSTGSVSYDVMIE